MLGKNILYSNFLISLIRFLIFFLARIIKCLNLFALVPYFAFSFGCVRISCFPFYPPWEWVGSPRETRWGEGLLPEQKFRTLVRKEEERSDGVLFLRERSLKGFCRPRFYYLLKTSAGSFNGIAGD